MKLLIVESPSKAKTISKYLDNKYTVKASVGHVRDLPKSNKNAIDLKNGFKPHYVIPEKKKDVVKELQKLAKKADEIVIATDPDREGEAIAWHIEELLGEVSKDSKKKIKRIAFHEITKEAVTEALKSPRAIDTNLRKAQEARRVLDRLVGYDLSGLIWKKVRYGLSAGRVQSPALRILVEREREIDAFNPETYWVLHAHFNTKPTQLTFTAKEEPREKERVDEIIKKGSKSEWIVGSVKERDSKRKSPAPFKTSTLQQTASSRIGFSPSRTMRVAQKLYEAGRITYMRTDSISLSKQAQSSALSVVKKEYGKKYAEGRIFKTKSKAAQEAHEAIRPTDLTMKSAGANAEQKKLYKLIRNRVLASQMKSAVIKRTTLTATAEDEDVPAFFLRGTRTMFEGWLKAEPESRGDDVEVPKLSEGDELPLEKIESEEKETQPPNRYSEAGLVKELEKRGIGRPSTYASIINTLEKRGYADKIQRSLHPTDTGEVVSGFLEENFMDYINDSFTAQMEDQLDEIAHGNGEYEKTIDDIYTPLHKEVEKKAKTAKKITTLGDAPKEFPCPDCDAPMVIKLGKNGKFMSCSKFPDCEGARTNEGKVLEGPKETGEMCPKCDNPLVEREGRYGKFISCSTYPKCKFVKESEEEKKRRSTGVACTECKKGEMMERRGRFGIFYSCSEYPDCKFAINAKPTGKKCPECGALMMEGTKTIPERCSDKKCPMHRPDKIEKKEEKDK